MLEYRPLGLALEEPVTYGQLLSQARVFRSDEADVVNRFITGARASVEQHTNINLHRERWYLQGDPCDFARFVAYSPYVVTATKDEVSQSPLPTLIRKAPNVYAFDLAAGDWIITINSGRSRAAVAAEYPQLAQAILQLAAHDYDNRNAGGPSLMNDSSFLRVLNSARVPQSQQVRA